MALIFPQDGDDDSGFNFSTWTDRTNVRNFVESGMDVTVDYGNDEFDLSGGRAFVSHNDEDKVVTVNDGEFTNVSLTGSATNHVFLNPDFGVNDSVSLEVNTTNTTPNGASLKIAEIDTSADTSTYRNRRPVVRARSGTMANVNFDESSGFLDDVTLTFGDSDDFSISYDSGGDELNVRDEGASQDLLTGDSSGLRFQVAVSLDSGQTLTLGDDLAASGGELIWDESSNSIPNANLDDNDLTISLGTHLSGSTSVSLGGTLNVSVDDDFVLNSGDTMTGDLTMGTNDLVGTNSTSVSFTSGGVELHTSGGGSGLITIYDEANTSDVARFNEGGSVEFPTGPVTIDTETVATQTWVNDNAGVDAEDDGATIVSNTTAINFASNLDVTDDTDGTVTVDAPSGSSVSDDGSVVVSGVSDINFATNLSVTDDGDGTVTVNTPQQTISHDGSTVLTDPSDIDFTSNVDVSDDGDGTLSVSVPDQWVDTTGDTVTGTLIVDAELNVDQSGSSLVIPVGTDAYAT